MPAASLAALTFALLSSLLWSGLDVCRKQMVRHVSPVALVTLLCLGQVLVFLPWSLSTGASPGLDYAPWGLASLGLNLVANLLFVRAVQVSPLSLTIPLLALTPVFAGVASVLAGVESVTPPRFFGMCLILLGAGVLTRGAMAPGERVVDVFRREPGMWMMLLVTALWACSIAVDKGALALDEVNEPTHALSQTAGVGAALLVWLASRGQLAELKNARRAPWLGIAMVLVALSALSMQLMALRTLDASVVETLKRTIALVVSLAAGRALFGESITRSKVAAVTLMIGGTLLVMAD